MPDFILGIETSNPAAHQGASAVGLGRIDTSGVVAIAEEAVCADSRVEDDLIPAIDRMMAKQGLRPADIRAVAVAVGPGGYTSIRMGVAAACAIARGVGAPVHAVPTALAVAVTASRGLPPGSPIAVCLAWKGDSVWRHRFRAGAKPEQVDRGALVMVDALDAAETIVCDAVLGARISERVAQGGGRVVAMQMLAGAVIEASAFVGASDPALVTPIYPREPEAVTKWNAMRAQGKR